MSDKNYDPISESMLEEEKRIQAETKRELAADKKRGQAWAQANSSEQKGQFGKLLHLVEQSKVSYRNIKIRHSAHWGRFLRQ